MDNIIGMRDRYGVELRRRKYLAAVFSQFTEAFGYEPLAVSLIERADAYSEDIVGKSPWPEWDRRSCFFFDIHDFADSYGTAPGVTEAILIPEGTVSVTRWLGNQLRSEDGASVNHLGKKVYYDIECFRNELTSSLWMGKGRAFSQFGVEILGADGVEADIEPLVLAHEMLLALDLENIDVVFRLSSNRLFLKLAEESGLNAAQRVELKEYLDTIAECKAGKKSERFPAAAAGVKATLIAASCTLADQSRWEYLVERATGAVTQKDHTALGNSIASELDYLDSVTSALISSNVQVEIDFCVVRSHEYYTGLTFEVDLVGEKRHVEVGGGGRYDRLLGNFVPEGFPAVIPSTGFAFGMERLLDALEQEGAFADQADASVTCNFALADHGSIQEHSLPTRESHGVLERARAYLDSVGHLRAARRTRRISAIVERS